MTTRNFAQTYTANNTFYTRNGQVSPELVEVTVGWMRHYCDNFETTEDMADAANKELDLAEPEDGTTTPEWVYIVAVDVSNSWC